MILVESQSRDWEGKEERSIGSQVRSGNDTEKKGACELLLRASAVARDGDSRN